MLKSLGNPLQQLQDIQTPPPIGWWPLAIGWWLLLIISILSIAGIIFFWLYSRNKSRLRRAALKELKQIEQDLNAGKRAELCVNAIGLLLKRFCINHFKSDHTAALSGTHWLKFLAQKAPKLEFDPTLEKLLTTTRFQQPQQDKDDSQRHQAAQRLIKICRRWLNQVC